MLEIKNLSSGYGKNEVLHGASLTVKKGEVISVIGLNGSGKSTLLKSIVGIVKPHSGKIIINGIDSDTMPRSKKAQSIAYLAQGRDVPDMIVGQMVLHGRFPYLGFPRVYSDNDKKIAVSAMEKVGIEELYNKPLKTLSGGTRQKVYIAMALAQDAEYILFDEPLTYLDITHQLELMRDIKELADSGKGIICVMHDLPLAFTFSDRVVIINDGEIVVEDTPENLYNSQTVKDLFKLQLKLNPQNTGYYIEY